jgi:hypothetical protein
MPHGSEEVCLRDLRGGTDSDLPWSTARWRIVAEPSGMGLVGRLVGLLVVMVVMSCLLGPPGASKPLFLRRRGAARASEASGRG